MGYYDCEVIIVGAGPTGLMSAALLARCGVRVLLFDKNPEQAHESRALTVQPRTLELFLSIGLADELIKRGKIITSARMFVDGKPKAELQLDAIRRPDTPYSSILIVSQRDTEAVLNEELRRLGVKVERAVEFTGLRQTDAGVTAHVKDAYGTEVKVEAQYLIGADGAHSLVRKALGLSFEGAAYPQNFLLADCRVQGLPFLDGFAMFLRGKSLGLFIPLPGEPGLGRILTMDSKIGGDEEQSSARQGGRDAPLSAVQESFRFATKSDVTLSDASWTSLYRVHHRGVDRYRVNRVFVAGDAAHIHSPAAGQGMNTGLQDAANLAWKLVLALCGQSRAQALLDSYHAERWPVGQHVLKATDEMFSTMTSQTGWFTALRNALVPRLFGILSHAKAARKRAFDFVSQLGIHYGQADATLDETGKGDTPFWQKGTASGHRAPDATLTRDQDVFGLLAGYKFHVLALSRRPLFSDEVQTVCDSLSALPEPPCLGLDAYLVAPPARQHDDRVIRAEAPDVFSAYGVDHVTPQALYLVRPDGYIAWRADGFDFAGLTGFLRSRFC